MGEFGSIDQRREGRSRGNRRAGRPRSGGL